MNAFSQRLWAAYLAVVLTLCLLFRGNLVPGWGQWYSYHLPLRLQTDRLLQGQVALSHQPETLSWDMAWDDGAVQQVWGLAVPLWRLLFEALARWTGHPAFPDRLAFALAFAGAGYAVIRFNFALAKRLANQTVSWSWLGVVPVVLFPPFLALCASRFLAYEEVVAYGHLAAMLLLIWAARLTWRPGLAGFLGLALAGGLIGFVRPTFLVYGAASVLIAARAVWRTRHDRPSMRAWRWLCPGGALFCAGVGLLLWSNAARFGGALEFGHSLNLNGLASMRYASRFDYPFRREPLGSATRELFGLLFLARPATADNAEQAVSFAGQSSTFRWREIYFSAYDLSYLPILAGAWIWLVSRGWRRIQDLRRGETTALDSGDPIEAMALWSLIAFVPLALFYLRAPFASSRYLLDFGPAMAAALWASTWLGFRWIRTHKPSSKWIVPAFAAAVLGWWGCEMSALKVKSDRAQPVRTSTWDEVEPLLNAASTSAAKQGADRALPDTYSTGFQFRSTGISFNGAGWSSGGETRSCVALFVRDPECLVLEVAPVDAGLNADSYECIQARIGLELLEREEILPMEGAMRLVFRGPQQARYRKGIQVAFLGMVPVEELSDGFSRFHLIKVSWSRRIPLTAR